MNVCNDLLDSYASAIIMLQALIGSSVCRMAR